MRLIDANALIKAFEKQENDFHSVSDFINSIATIDIASTIDAEPVRHGRWIRLEGRKYARPHKCSICRNGLDFSAVNAGRGDANYCPNCGAKMDLDEVEE